MFAGWHQKIQLGHHDAKTGDAVCGGQVWWMPDAGSASQGNLVCLKCGTRMSMKITYEE